MHRVVVRGVWLWADRLFVDICAMTAHDLLDHLEQECGLAYDDIVL